MKTNKSTVVIIIIVVVLIILGGSILFFLYQQQYKAKNITNFFDNDASKINKIDIVNGNNGKVISVTDKKIISDISTYLSKLKLKKVSLPQSSGWSYRFSIIEKDKDVLDITFNGDLYCKINDSKYKIEKSTDITINLLYDEASKLSK